MCFVNQASFIFFLKRENHIGMIIGGQKSYLSNISQCISILLWCYSITWVSCQLPGAGVAQSPQHCPVCLNLPSWSPLGTGGNSHVECFLRKEEWLPLQLRGLLMLSHMVQFCSNAPGWGAPLRANKTGSKEKWDRMEGAYI